MINNLTERHQEIISELVQEANGDLSIAGAELAVRGRKCGTAGSQLRKLALQLVKEQALEDEQRIEARHRALIQRERQRRRVDPYQHIRGSSVNNGGSEVLGGWSQLVDPYLSAVQKCR